MFCNAKVVAMRQTIPSVTREIERMSSSWSARSDEQLEAIMYEVGYWMVKGQQGQILVLSVIAPLRWIE